MSADEVHRQCVAQIRLRAYDDRYIDQDEEREILQILEQEAASADALRDTLSKVCDRHNFVLESRVLADVKKRLANGKIDEKDFHDAVTTCKARFRGKKDETQVKRLIVEMIEDNGFQVKTGMFRNWYAKVKREVGLG
jgi:hypothetical protein